MKPNSIPRFVGALLLVSAMLKAFSGPSLASTLGNRTVDQVLHYAIVNVELLLAAGCMFMLAPRLLRSALLVLFGSFAAYAVYLVLVGAESCGCFGPVKVHPAWTLVLDCTVLGLLFLWKPIEKEAELNGPQNRRWTACLATFVVVAIPTGLWMGAHKPTVLPDDQRLMATGGIIILEPETWQGKPLPIIDHIDLGSQVRHGEWLLLLYHQGCPKCQTAVPLYQKLARELGRQGKPTQVALIETPPHDLGFDSAEHQSACIHGRLSNRHDWFVQTPVEIFLKEGQVVGTSTDLSFQRELSSGGVAGHPNQIDRRLAGGDSRRDQTVLQLSSDYARGPQP